MPLICTKKPKLLRIVIPTAPLNSGLESPERSSLFSSTGSLDSLFDDTSEKLTLTSSEDETVLAIRTAPPVAGLFFDPTVLLPQEIADEVVAFCMKTYFLTPQDNQVMLFGRFSACDPSLSSASGLPQILLDLLDRMSTLLRPVVPPETYDMLFPTEPTQARQAIINLYQSGEGITPHVDLLGRYGDGIVGVSFSSGCVMRFDKVECKLDGEIEPHRWDVYLPERSMIVLSGDARYGWTHGIDKKMRDFVESEASTSGGSWIDRTTRISITFRWLLPGADVVGETGF